MEAPKKKVQNFTDLRVWQDGHALVLHVYRLTRDFPREEQFGLTSQLRRAAVSFTSNIAEGFSRGTAREKMQFYSIALGSLSEVESQLLIARDIGYLRASAWGDYAGTIRNLKKMAFGLMKTSETRKF